MASSRLSLSVFSLAANTVMKQNTLEIVDTLLQAFQVLLDSFMLTTG